MLLTLRHLRLDAAERFEISVHICNNSQKHRNIVLLHKGRARKRHISYSSFFLHLTAMWPGSEQKRKVRKKSMFFLFPTSTFVAVPFLLGICPPAGLAAPLAPAASVTGARSGGGVTPLALHVPAPCLALAPASVGRLGTLQGSRQVPCRVTTINIARIAKSCPESDRLSRC